MKNHAHTAEQIVLEQVKGTASISEPLLNLPKIENTAKFRAAILDRWQELQLMLTVRYKGEKLQSTTKKVTTRYPAGWWQMLKQQHAPQWFLKRWPVKWWHETHEVTFQRFAVYPQLPLIYTDLKPVDVEMFLYSQPPSPWLASEDDLV